MSSRRDRGSESHEGPRSDAWVDKLRSLVAERRIASIGTLNVGAPRVSMVPFAMAPDGSFLIHASRLAQHTQDFLSDPRVGLLIAEPEGTGRNPLVLARLSVEGEIEVIEPGHEDYQASEAAYLGRFPQAGMTFELGDFAVYLIRTKRARFVAGFGSIHDLSDRALREILTA